MPHSLPSIGTPRRNDSNYLIRIPIRYCMRDVQHNRTANCSNHFPPQFAVHNAIMLKHCVGILKHFNGIVEADPVLPQIARGLRLVPLK